MGKKIFLDTNIVADIIDAKRVNHVRSMELMKKLIVEGSTVCISEDMITTLFYISKEKSATLQFFKNVVFVDWEILYFGNNVLIEGVDLALESHIDLEDLLQCLCAKKYGCDTIITNDLSFSSCGIEVKKMEEYMQFSL